MAKKDFAALSQLTKFLEFRVKHIGVIKKFSDLIPLSLVVEELENHIQVLLVYLLALSLMNAGLACLFSTTFLFYIILVRDRSIILVLTSF